MSENCIFCRIISGIEPAKLVYRDANVIAFFPRSMQVKAHTLIIPVHHYTDIFDMPEDISSELMRVSRHLGLHYNEKLGSEGINLMNASGKAAQQSIFHFHFHLLPRFSDDGLDTWPKLPTWEGNSMELLKILKV